MFRARAHIYTGSLFFLAATLFGLWFLGNTSPEEAAREQMLVVYLAVFFWISSGGFLLGYMLRRILRRNGEKSESIRSARRQAVLLGLFAAAILWLEASEILTPKIGLMALGIFILLEFWTQ